LLPPEPFVGGTPAEPPREEPPDDAPPAPLVADPPPASGDDEPAQLAPTVTATLAISD
jgi:hypothetical protein